jgi:hypothetical protein
VSHDPVEGGRRFICVSHTLTATLAERYDKDSHRVGNGIEEYAASGNSGGEHIASLTLSALGYASSPGPPRLCDRNTMFPVHPIDQAPLVAAADDSVKEKEKENSNNNAA